MRDATDMDLVRDYARNHSEAAFAELVRRHLNLVYSVAWRYAMQDGDAQDIAQAAAFLLSEEASYVNGTSLVLDGGTMALPPW